VINYCLSTFYLHFGRRGVVPIAISPPPSTSHVRRVIFLEVPTSPLNVLFLCKSGSSFREFFGRPLPKSERFFFFSYFLKAYFFISPLPHIFVGSYVFRYPRLLRPDPPGGALPRLCKPPQSLIRIPQRRGFLPLYCIYLLGRDPVFLVFQQPPPLFFSPRALHISRF